MLRYPSDRRTLAFIATYFALVTWQWIYFPHQLLLAIPLLMITCIFSFLGAVATHNSLHAPPFVHRWANRVFQVVLTLTYGHPVSAYVPGHNLTHHKYTQLREDLMRTSKIRYRWNLLNLVFFQSRVVKDILRWQMHYYRTMRRRRPAWFRQLIIEFAFSFGSSAILAVIDWRKFLLYVLLPHQFAAWGIVTINLLQHDGTDENTEYNHSRNFVGPFINWWTMNNGFHSIHHHHPGMHWSLTPAAHAAEIAPHIHPALDQPSMAVYLWKQYVWPGRRMRYDGKPVVLLPLEADQWTSPEAMPRDVSLGAIAAEIA